MTAPLDSSPPIHSVPLPFRVAAGLCAVVGVLSVIGAVAIRMTPMLAFAINLTAALAMCGAAAASWKGRRWSVWLIILAWALPNANNLVFGASVRPPSLLMVLALITLVANWNALR